MDGLTFLIRLIEALALPGAAVVIAFLFRNEFRVLVPLIRKLKAGPLEAEFEREIQEISEEKAVLAEPEIVEELAPRQQMLRDLAHDVPRAAILEAWMGVESAVRMAALQKVASSPPPDVSSPIRAIRELQQWGAIGSDEVALFHDLRGLRNQAAHLPDFNPGYEAALNYVDLAVGLESRLKRLATVN